MMLTARRSLAITSKIFIVLLWLATTRGDSPLASSETDIIMRLILNPLTYATLLAAWSETPAGRGWRDWTDKLFAWRTLPVCLVMAFFWIALSVGDSASTGL